MDFSRPIQAAKIKDKRDPPIFQHIAEKLLAAARIRATLEGQRPIPCIDLHFPRSFIVPRTGGARIAGAAFCFAVFSACCSAVRSVAFPTFPNRDTTSAQ